MTNSTKNTVYQPDEIPQEITRDIFLYYGVGRYVQGEISIDDYERDEGTGDEDWGRVLLARHEMTFSIPTCIVDLKAKKLEILNVKKQNILAENHKRLKDVQDKIDALLSIDFKPSSIAEETEIPF